MTSFRADGSWVRQSSQALRRKDEDRRTTLIPGWKATTALAVALIQFATCWGQTSSPKDAPPGSNLLEARRAIAMQDWETAERDLREVLRLQGASPDPHFLLGYVLFRQHHPTESLAEYTAGAHLRTPDADELIVVASDYILLKDYPDAERWLLHATEHWPANATAWYLLGRTQYNLDRAATAAASFRRSLELSPRDVRAEYNLGLALEKLDRPADAESAYQTAIAWQQGAPKRDSQPYLDLGMLLLSQHHADRALPALREAVALGPRNPLAYQELGLALDALGSSDEAIQALQKATTLAPDAEQPHFLLGRLLRRLGRANEAAAQFSEVQRITGSHSEKDTPNEP